MGILSWSRVTKSRLPFEVNVMLNLSVTISWEWTVKDINGDTQLVTCYKFAFAVWSKRDA